MLKLANVLRFKKLFLTRALIWRPSFSNQIANYQLCVKHILRIPFKNFPAMFVILIWV